jgi:hypothetical protein
MRIVHGRELTRERDKGTQRDQEAESAEDGA